MKYNIKSKYTPPEGITFDVRQADVGFTDFLKCPQCNHRDDIQKPNIEIYIDKQEIAFQLECSCGCKWEERYRLIPNGFSILEYER